MDHIDHAEIERDFLAFYEAHAEQLFRHCVARVSDRELAKDLTQEVFMRMWKHLADGNSITSIRSFMYRIANNLIIDFYRKKKAISLEMIESLSEEKLAAEPEEEEVPEAVYTPWEVTRIKRNLKRLESKYRDVIIMRYMDNLSPREIAKLMHDNANAVSVRIHRALKKLRNLFNHEHSS